MSGSAQGTGENDNLGTESVNVVSGKSHRGKFQKDVRVSVKVGLVEMCLRINGYLEGCFSRGARYIIWDKYRFSKATRTHRPRQVSHVEQAMTLFRKTSTNWNFETIYYAGQGQDRPHRRIKITPARQLGAPSQLEVSRRFLAYIVSAVKRNGTARVDLVFLNRFIQTSRVPEEWARIAWQRIKKIRGYRTRWRGTGRGRKLMVTMPHFPTRHSIYYVDEDRKQAARCAGTCQTDLARRSPHESRDVAGTAASDDRDARPVDLAPSPPLPGGEPPAGAPPPAENAEAAANAGSGARKPPAARRSPPPFQIAGRWISGAKILRKAEYLSAVEIRALHVPSLRVSWRFAHSRNYAMAALRAGYSSADIVGSWGLAIQRSHEDACDADLKMRPISENGPPQREPSAAVCYAWQILAKDKRTTEQRWSDFFTETQGGAKPKARAVRSVRSVEVVRENPAPRPLEFPAQKRVDQRTIEQHLKAHGLTLEQLLKMPRAEKDAFVKAAFLEQRGK